MKLKKALSLLLSLLILLSLAAPALADEGMTQVTTFGFNDSRDRYALNGLNPPNLWRNWKADVGKSYSQPLILGEVGEDPVVIAAAGNKLHAWRSPKLTAPRKDFADLSPLWSLPLKGDNPTKSHPTLVELNGRKLIFIGSDHDSAVNGAWLQVFDVTDITQPVRVFSDFNKDITDVVSAPLVLDWHGHPICVITCGNTSRAAIFMNMDNIGKGSVKSSLGFLDLSAGGRTSSSPAPVLGGRGFAVGLDGGANSGKMVIYMLDDILGEENGKVVLKAKSEYVKANLQSGLCASFSVGDGLQKGQYLYYGDSRSRVYCYDVLNLTHLWVRDYAPGVFSNRSPALGKENVYFPAMGGSSINDVRNEYHNNYTPRLLAIDRQTGDLAWKVDWLWRLQTAPVIWSSSVYGPVIFIGDRDGFLNLFNAGDGTQADTSTNISRSAETDIYAAGVSGEISAANGILAVSTEEGIRVWSGLPFDLEVAELDTGVPAGQQAQIGQTYTATVKVRYKKSPVGEGLPWYVEPNIGAFHVVEDTAYRAQLQYMEEQPALGSDLFVRDDGEEKGQQYMGLVKQGEEYVLKFNWTAQANSKMLEVVINKDYPEKEPILLTKDVPELKNDEANNQVSAILQVNGYDIKVKIIPEDTNITTINGEPTEISYSVDVTRKDNIPGSIGVTGAMVQKTGSDDFILDLAPGETKKAYNSFSAGPGTYTIEAEAWPDGTDDIYPSDNRDRVTVSVTSKNFDPKTEIHVERLR